MRMTLESVRLRLLLIPFAAAALTVACGEGTALQSPTGPSPLQGSAALMADDAVDGVVTASSAGDFETLAKGGNGKGKGKSDDDEADATSGKPEGGGNKPDNGGGPGHSHQDKVVGFVSAKSGDTITVNGVSITAGTDAVIRHGHRQLTMADIEVGDHVQARGTRDGSKLVATEIKVEDTDHDDDDADDAELKGTISDLNLTTTPCPNITFKIGTTVVKTNSSTDFDGAACSALANGNTVEVEGTKQADGSITAASVEKK